MLAGSSESVLLPYSGATHRGIPSAQRLHIGCGMLAVRFRAKRLELQKLDKLIWDSIPSGKSARNAPHHFAERASLGSLHCLHHVQKDKALCAVGTLGGGNHFIEVDKTQNGDFWLIIHSGSRRLGVKVASFYQNEAFHQCPEETPFELAYATGSLIDDYLHDMRITQAFAELNRRAIANDIIKGILALKTRTTPSSKRTSFTSTTRSPENSFWTSKADRSCGNPTCSTPLSAAISRLQRSVCWRTASMVRTPSMVISRATSISSASTHAMQPTTD